MTLTQETSIFHNVLMLRTCLSSSTWVIAILSPPWCFQGLIWPRKVVWQLQKRPRNIFVENWYHIGKLSSQINHGAAFVLPPSVYLLGQMFSCYVVLATWVPCCLVNLLQIYLSAVGSLMYLATQTHPDISYIVRVLAQFNSNPGYCDVCTEWNKIWMNIVRNKYKLIYSTEIYLECTTSLKKHE
jgi:hypothetical protein